MAINPQKYDVAWYRKHGLYPERRIRHMQDGSEFVVGDWSWNTNGNPKEYVDEAMRQDFLRRTEEFQPAVS